MKKLILISVILAFSLTCLAQKGQWKKAQKINTIESYQGFIEKYPSSEYLEEAKLNLTKLEFYRAKDKNSIIAYEDFLKKYPKSKFAIEANSWIKEKQKELEAIKQAEQQAEQLRKNSIAKIKQYSVGVTTDEQFYKDGWNAKDPLILKMGILTQNAFTPIGLLSVTLGYWNYYCESCGDNAQTMYNYVFERADKMPSSFNYSITGDTPNKVCFLSFKDGLLQNIEWYIK